MTALRLLLLGTDTDVGKTWITVGLTQTLRSLGRRVWLHKPVACGDWDGSSAADGRSLRAVAGDGQDLADVCPREFPEAASPHLAARAAGHTVDLDALVATAQALSVRAGSADLLVEGAGGLLSPLASDRRNNRDLARALGWPVLLVTRPHLGTLNHTALSVEAARGLDLRGLVVNHHQPGLGGLAVRAAAEELEAITGCPVLAEPAFAAPADTWAPAVVRQLLR